MRAAAGGTANAGGRCRRGAPDTGCWIFAGLRRAQGGLQLARILLMESLAS
jgi:hypothetical protein